MFGKLLSAFADRKNAPVDVQEVANFLIKFGCQDSIFFHPEELDPGELKGLYLQFTKRKGVYAAPDLVTLIIYPKDAPTEWQRLICCKELIHVCDGHNAMTNTPEEVDALVEKLLGPLSTDDFGVADFMASVDKIALYQAMAVLFPAAARDEARAQIEAGAATVEAIAAWTQLPVEVARLVLADDWLEIYSIIEDLP
jgi:hypothetical protein